MNQDFTIGDEPWSYDDLRNALPEFEELYRRRPFQDNQGGMKAPHMFYTWFALRHLKPTTVIESGVFMGHGTWLIEQACPDAVIYCLDPRQDRIAHWAAKASYSSEDFSAMDWSGVDPESTVVLFDDHQNGYERLKNCKWFGFKHILFDDNYPALQGNCYSPKQVLLHCGFVHVPEHPPTLRGKIKTFYKRVIGAPVPHYPTVKPNRHDEFFFRKNISRYYEFPPVVASEKSLWGDEITPERYPTREALVPSPKPGQLPIFQEDAREYVWYAYVTLR